MSEEAFDVKCLSSFKVLLVLTDVVILNCLSMLLSLKNLILELMHTSAALPMQIIAHVYSREV